MQGLFFLPPPVVRHWFKSNKNETSKIFVSIKKQEQEELNREIASYKLGKAAPIQVVGDDTISAQNFPDTSDIRTGK